MPTLGDVYKRILSHSPATRGRDKQIEIEIAGHRQSVTWERVGERVVLTAEFPNWMNSCVSCKREIPEGEKVYKWKEQYNKITPFSFREGLLCTKCLEKVSKKIDLKNLEILMPLDKFRIETPNECSLFYKGSLVKKRRLRWTPRVADGDKIEVRWEIRVEYAKR